MTFSRRVSSPPQAVNAAEVVRDVEKMMRPVIRENIELVVDAPPGLPQLFTDPGQIEQVLVNLCLNARDAIAEAGRITISLATRKFDSLEAARQTLQGPGIYLLLSVADTGCGIPSEIREKIFEPFFTTKEVGKGTGLGLAMVYSLIKQNRGRIEVQSEPDKGSVFTIYLPALAAKPAAKRGAGGCPRRHAQRARAHPHGGGRPQFRRLHQEPARYARLHHRDRRQRRGSASTSSAPTTEILTCSFPTSCCPSFPAARWPRNCGCNTPSCACSSCPATKTSARWTNLGAGTDRLQKPFSLNALLERVRRLLDGPGAARPPRKSPPKKSPAPVA